MSTLETNLIQPSTGTTLTLGANGDTITVPSGATFTNSGVMSGQNYPAFEAYGSTEQTGVASNTYTKMQFNTEVYDTNSNYDNATNYRFTPTTAGKYFVYSGLSMYSDSAFSAFVFNTAIYKNGSVYKITPNNCNSSYPESERFCIVSAVIDFNGSTDYVETYARVVTTTGTCTFDIRQNQGTFGAYRLGS